MTLLSTDTSSVLRIRITDKYAPAAPGKCAICGTTEGPFVDIGMDIEFYGALYFCIENCLREMANAFEYKSPAQWKDIKGQNSLQRDQINELLDENEKLRASVNLLTNPSGGINSRHSRPEPYVDEFKQENNPIDPGQVLGSITKVESDEPGPVKSDAKPGPADVSSNDSMDDYLTSDI